MDRFVLNPNTDKEFSFASERGETTITATAMKTTIAMTTPKKGKQTIIVLYPFERALSGGNAIFRVP